MILAEICGSTQRHPTKPGDAQILDPEGRLDKEFSEMCGLSVQDKGFVYKRPNTVTEMFAEMYGFKSKKPGIAVTATDGLAALSTEMELGVDKDGEFTFEGEDKFGGRRAKEYSQGFRKFGRFIASDDRLLIASNQIRDDFKTGGTTTTGGHGIKHYSSLRVEVKQLWKGWKIERNRTFRTEKSGSTEGKKISQVVGAVSNCFVKKSSIDAPFREAQIFIVFKYGIDDVRGNLQYLKDMLKLGKYEFRDLSATGMDMMIQKVEEAGLVKELKEEVILLWGEIDEIFETDRKPKY